MRNPSSIGRPLPERAASRSLRNRRLGQPGDHLGELVGPLHACAARVTSSTKPIRSGLMSVDHPPGDDQIDGTAVTEDPGEPQAHSSPPAQTTPLTAAMVGW